MNWKIFLMVPLFAAFFALTACSESEPENEKVDELEEWVIQVEKSIEDGEVKDWNEFEQEFHQRMDAIEDGTDDLSEKIEDRIDNLETRWEKAKDKMSNQS